MFECRCNSFWSNGAVWHHRTWSTLLHVMVCCLMTPRHYLNQCWLTISYILWHSFQGNGDFNTHDINPQVVFELYAFKLTATSSRDELIMIHIYIYICISHNWCLQKSVMWPVLGCTDLLLCDECPIGHHKIHWNNEIHKNEDNNTCGLSKWMFHSRSLCPSGPHICISVGGHLDNGIYIAKHVI